MMRLFVFTAMGWVLAISGEPAAQLSTSENAAPVQVVQLAPSAQADNGGTAGTAATAEGETSSADPKQAEDNRIGDFAKTPYALFLDSFQRPDDDDVSANPAGQGGLVAPLNYAEPSDGENALQSCVAGGKLILGDNSDATPGSHLVLKHNFIYAELIELGGFSVSLRVEEIAAPDSPPDLDSYWLGFGVGLTEAALTDTTVNYVQQNADFFLALTKANNLQVFQRGTQVGEDIPLETPPAGSPPPTIRAKFVFDDFAAGAKVNYQLFSRGEVVGSGSFKWAAEAQNYVGVDGNSGGTADNLLIALTEAAAERCVRPGWLDDVPRKPGTSLIARWLHLIDSAEEIDPDGKMHKKITDDQKKQVRNTLLEIDNDMQRLLKGDPSIAERDPNKQEFYSEEEARDELRKRTMARPEPKPALARTPGVVLEDNDERVSEAGGGQVFQGSGAVDTGTKNRHGTVIHKGKFSRGGGGGAIPPRVIVIPPSKRPTPPPTEPAPASPES